MPEDVVDLTLDDEDAVLQPQSKKLRPSANTKNQDNEDVIIFVPETRNCAAEPNQNPQTLDGDDEVIIEGVVGQLPLVDMPHTRKDCGVHNFSPTPCVQNALHCPQCFCYVCDCRIAECKYWGTGARSNDHCNAMSDKNVYWDKILGARRRGNHNHVAAEYNKNRPKPTAPQPVPPPKPTASSAFRRTPPKSATPQQQFAAAAAAARAKNAGPVSNVNFIHQALEELQATLAGKIPGLASNLTPAAVSLNAPASLQAPGVASTSGSAAAVALPAGTSTFGPTTVASTGKLVSSTLVKDPLALPPLPYGLTVLPDPALNPNLCLLGTLRFPVKICKPYTFEAVQQRIVPHGLRSSPVFSGNYAERIYSQTLSTSVKKETGCKGFLELLPLPDPSPKPNFLYRVQIVDVRARHAPVIVGVELPADARVRDVPAGLANKMVEYTGVAMDICEYMLPTLRPCGGRLVMDSEASTELGPLGLDVIVFRGLNLLTDKGKERERYVAVIARPKDKTMSWRTQYMLLPIAAEDYLGGQGANTRLVERYLKSLEPFRRSASAGPSPFHVALFVPGGPKPDIPFCQVQAQSIMEQVAKLPNGLAMLYGRLDAAALATSLDVSRIPSPRVHESASANAIEAFADAKQIYAAQVAWRKELPQKALNEIQRYCQPPREYDEKNKQKQTSHGELGEGCASMALVDKDGENNATLEIKLYVYRSICKQGKTPIVPWDTAVPEECSFAHCLDLMLLNHPQAQNMYQRIRTVNQWKLRSVPEFLASAETPERTPATQPDGLSIAMRPYQLQTLAFCLEAESAPHGYRDLLWVQVPGANLWYSPVMRRLSKNTGDTVAGGILAEEMGLGKTVEVLALILANPAPPVPLPRFPVPPGMRPSGATLVVCAVSLVGQWVEEVKEKAPSRLRVYSFYGSNRIRRIDTIAHEYDVVVTTYETLSSDMNMAAREDFTSPLMLIHWHRVIFDEGHVLRAQTTGKTKNCIQLSSNLRWVCTGTPASTALEDFQGQLNAIGFKPLGDKTTFDKLIKPSLQHGGRFGQPDRPILPYVISCLMVRHTKAKVLHLPPKHETVLPVNLSSEEIDLYTKKYEEVKAEWKRINMRGSKAVMSSLFHITSLLLPLRRICSGGPLTMQELTVGGKDAEASGAGASGSITLENSGLRPTEGECSICLDPYEMPVVTPCSHWFCRECITSALTSRSSCPNCRSTVTVEQLKTGETGSDPKPEDASTSTSDKVHCMSKLKAVVRELQSMRASDPEARALVFSQFTSTLDALKPLLNEAGLRWSTITGSMNASNRTSAIQAFAKSSAGTTFLMSLRTGAVGINLTAANTVLILDPCVNPALEEQAIGRVWRMGQVRPVTVKRMYVPGSVEEAIMETVRKRLSGAAAGASSPGSSSVDPAKEKTTLKMDELERLFQAPTLQKAD